MSDTPIILNKARKTKTKADARRQADENAVKFGRSKAAKAKDAAVTVLSDRQLDGAKREP